MANLTQLHYARATMLERVAMHQTRLRLPGLGIDGKGVVLGSRGLVLLASIERLVAFLSLYTSERSMAALSASLRIEVVRSKLGTREIVLSFSTQNSEQLDQIAEVARVALGHTFTGTSRHFVQFRDAAAPFGYDASEVIASDSDYVLYHTMFTQVYARERAIDLPSLLLRLRPRLDPSTGRTPGALWILAEEGLGPAWIHYLIRSHIDARVGLVQWPPLSALDEGPVHRYLFDVPQLPARVLPLARATPGLGVFFPTCPGAAVEIGYRHPITLRACPVFDEAGLVLLRGTADPVVIERLPSLGEVAAFAQVSYNDTQSIFVGKPIDPAAIPQVRVPVRLAPSVEALTRVKASFIRPEEYLLLRRMLYALGPQTLRQSTIAFTQYGAILQNPAGVESTPVGIFLREIRQGMLIVAGYDAVPAIDTDVLYKSLGSPADQVVVLMPNAQPFGVARSAFITLQDAMIEGQTWAPLNPTEIGLALDAPVPRVRFDRAPEPGAVTEADGK